ncbi:MAG: hypothetical protein Q8R38_03725 [Candidatus Omnitrophota bacterium]|nr:hypothetical protein [Candidatus Omnitrophota bacterium]
MRKYLVYAVLISAIMTFAAAGPVFAQSEDTQAAAKEEVAQTSAAATPAKEEAPKLSELSIYGEVQTVNVQALSMMVQYYDYDNDEEKSTEITLDGSSKLENAKTIADIKKGDWVDVTYIVSAGKNIAKVISVEKEEPIQDENAPEVED